MSWKVLEGKRVAVLVETEFVPKEVDYYRHCFPLLGAQVDFMTHLWGEKSRKLVSDITNADDPMSEIRTMTVDIEVADRDPNDYDIVICCANYVAVRLREIPPMGSHGSIRELDNPPAVHFFAEAMKNKSIVKGALCHALWILTPTPELLKERRVICHTVVLADVHNAGAIYAPNREEIVVDGDLVTGRSAANVEAYVDALVETAIAL
jgi:protease I